MTCGGAKNSPLLAKVKKSISFEKVFCSEGADYKEINVSKSQLMAGTKQQNHMSWLGRKSPIANSNTNVTQGNPGQNQSYRQCARAMRTLL